MRARIRNATDAGIDLDRVAVVPATPRGPAFLVVMEGSGPWDWEAWQDEVRAKVGPEGCPVCWGRRLPRSWMCLRCNRMGTDGKVSYPGLPVGKYPDPDWEAGPTAYVSHVKLKGGLGERVKGRKGRKVG